MQKPVGRRGARRVFLCFSTMPGAAQDRERAGAEVFQRIFGAGAGVPQMEMPEHLYIVPDLYGCFLWFFTEIFDFENILCGYYAVLC